MNKLFSRLLVAVFFLTVLGTTKALATNTAITVGAGTWDNPKWNAYVHVPSTYAANPNKLYPTIIFFPGLGEVGTMGSGSNAYVMNASTKVINNGPGAYIKQGWNGNITTSDGVAHEFIVISLQTPEYPSPTQVKQKVDQLKSTYRIDPNRLHFTGLSHGGWVSNATATYKPSYYDTDYLDLAASIVDVEGVPVNPEGFVEGVTPYYYPQNFVEYAQRNGKELGFEQVGDFRDIQTMITAMNATNPGSGVYFQTNFGGGGHCCWSSFYGGGGTNPSNFTIDGVSQNIYQWMARQVRHQAPISGGTTVSNYPPRVNAGADVVVTYPITSVGLMGTAIDPEGGSIANYTWSQVSGPAQAMFIPWPETNNNENHTGIFLSGPGVYVFRLTATDSGGASNYDDVVVQQRYSTNDAPLVNAGEDRYITVGGDVVPTANASDSSPSGYPLYYRWDMLQSPGPWTSYTPNSHILDPQLKGFTQAGDYRYRLTVTDVFGASATDEMIVHVGSTVNVSPVANAGPDKTVYLPATSTTLSSLSTDSDGSIVSYAWTQVAGPGTATITSATAAAATVSSLTQGVYTFRLTVTDDDGGTAQDMVQVTLASPLIVAAGAVIHDYKLDTNTIDWDEPDAEIRSSTSESGRGDAVGFTSGNAITGKVGQALTFPTNGYITVPDAWNFSQYFDVNPNEGMTLSLWARFSATPSGNTLIAQGPNGNILRIVANANNTITSTLKGASITSPAIAQSTLVNNWIHIAVTYKSGQQTLYVNGVQQATGAIGSLTSALQPIIFGGMSNGSTIVPSFGTHSLDDIRIYRGALTQSALLSVYNSTDNEPPSVDVGPDQTNAEASVPVSATVIDKENAITWMTWRGYDTSDVSGNPPYTVVFTNPHAAATEATGLAVGHTYRLQFVVQDDRGQQAADSLLVTVTQSSGRPATFAAPVSGGTTLTIPAGEYPDGILIENAVGTAARPFTIINNGGVVTTSSLVIDDSQDFTLSGSGSADQFGFRITGGEGVDAGITVTGKSSDYTIEQTDISDAETGIAIVPEVSDNASENYPAFTVKNIVLKDNKIASVDNGMVVGATRTSAGAAYPARLEGVKIFNNLIQQIDGTGIQLTNARDNNEVYDNVIVDTRTAVVSGVNTNSNVYSNVIDGATNGVQVRGYGITNIVGNTFKRVTRSAVIAQRGSSAPEVTPALDLRVTNNTLQFPTPLTIDTTDLALASTVVDNLFCNTTLTAAAFISSSSGSDISGNQVGADACGKIKETPTTLKIANTAVVTASLLNIRGGALLSAPIIQQVARGTILTVTGPSSDGWTPVLTDSGPGYVSTTYIQEDASVASAFTSLNVIGKQVRVLPSNLNLRLGPSTDTRIVAVLTRGDIVEVYALSPVNNWLLIRTQSGRVGYIARAYVEEVK